MPSNQRTAPTALPASGTYIVTSMDQAKVLVDPLRARILREFVEAPRTTKQVAERLGEKPTRLYRHVDALAETGLLTLKGERKKRGTVERYFQAVASRFEIGRSLFQSTDDRSHADASQMVSLLFQNAESEILAAVQGHDDDDELGPFAMRAEIRAGAREIKKLRDKLLEWVEECSTKDQGDSGGDKVGHYATVVAFFPVQPPVKSTERT